MDIAQLIQKQVRLGSLVIITLKTGQQVSGTLVEISINHVLVEQSDGNTTILIDAIGSWKVLSSDSGQEHLSSPRSNPQDSAEEATVIVDDSAITSLRQVLHEIRVRFEARLDALQSIDPDSPDFQIDEEELRSWGKSGASSIWQSAKSKYEYAVKVNELGGKFGRVQPIIAQLKTIEARYPRSLAVKRQISFLNYLSGNLTESIRLLEEGIRSRGKPD